MVKFSMSSMHDVLQSFNGGYALYTKEDGTRVPVVLLEFHGNDDDAREGTVEVVAAELDRRGISIETLRTVLDYDKFELTFPSVDCYNVVSGRSEQLVGKRLRVMPRRQWRKCLNNRSHTEYLMLARGPRRAGQCSPGDAAAILLPSYPSVADAIGMLNEDDRAVAVSSEFYLHCYGGVIYMGYRGGLVGEFNGETGTATLLGDAAPLREQLLALVDDVQIKEAA